MLVDGKQISIDIKRDLKERVLESGLKYRLAVIYAGDNSVINSFVEMKKKFGDDIFIDVDIFRYDKIVAENELVDEIKRLTSDNSYDGVIIQLPLPEHIDTDLALNVLSAEKDIDVLGYNSKREYIAGRSRFTPPVAGAVSEILERNNVEIANKKIVIVGSGRLVGEPVKLWFDTRNIETEVIDEFTSSPEKRMRIADIIISGAGVPHMITPGMIKSGVVLIDAGASECSGKIVGDIEPSCAQKAILYTPVPGGIGPITIAILFRNLVQSKR